MNILQVLSIIVNLCLLLFVGLALTLPRWVVGSYRGEGHVGPVLFNVDVRMGDGLWTRNVCFGKSAPEDLLNKAGFSCKGTPQTKGCDASHLTDDKKEECTLFYAAQTLQIFALFFALAACAAACQGAPNKMGLLGSGFLWILTSILIAIVIQLLKHTYLYDNHERVRFPKSTCGNYQIELTTRASCSFRARMYWGQSSVTATARHSTWKLCVSHSVYSA